MTVKSAATGIITISALAGNAAYYTLPTTNLKLWLDANVAGSITSSAGKVSQWNDQSGQANHFVQATSAYQPSTGVATINGKNAIQFNNGSTSHKMASNAAASVWTFMSNATGCTVFTVGRYANAGIEGFILSTFDGSTSTSGYAHIFTTNSYAITFNGGTSALSVVNNAGVAPGVTNPFMYTSVNDPSNATASARNKIYFNSNSVIQNNTLTAATGTSTPQTTLTIGNVGITNSPYVGTLGEIIVYSGQLSTSDISGIHTYLKAKWGTP